MGLRILITGGAGYLGSVLCEKMLDSGHEVTVVDSLVHGQTPLFHLCSHPSFEFVRGDVRDERLMRQLVADADAIFPLAAVVGAPACDRDPWLANAVNWEAIQLLNRLRSPSQRVIFPVTNSGYGAQSAQTFCTEETPLEPLSLYGRTKVQAEAELLSSEGVIALRLATVFGMSPRMRTDLLVNHFVYAAYTERYLVIFEKDFKRNYIHIRDVADCFEHCLQNFDSMQGRPYNLGLSSANLSKQELAEKVKEKVPDFYVHYAEVGSDPDKRNYLVSNERLRLAGYEAARSLEEGIEELLKGYRMLPRLPTKNV